MERTAQGRGDTELQCGFKGTVEPAVKEGRGETEEGHVDPQGTTGWLMDRCGEEGWRELSWVGVTMETSCRHLDLI